MLLWALRGLFIVLIAAVAFTIGHDFAGNVTRFYSMVSAIGVALVLIGIDMFLPRKSLAALSGAFLGLVVGMVGAWGLGLVLDSLVKSVDPDLAGSNVVGAVKLMLGTICCYLTISFVLLYLLTLVSSCPFVIFYASVCASPCVLLKT